MNGSDRDLAEAFSTGVVNYTSSMAGTHLGHALDLHHHAIDLKKARSRPYDGVLSHRSAMSSALHAFVALEGYISLLGHHLFSQPSSHLYIPPTERTFLLSQFVGKWDRNPSVTEKYAFLADLKAIVPSASMVQRLREVALLRNMLAHGTAFEIWVLLEPMGDGSFLAIDRDDFVKWREKFPNLKFHSLDSLDFRDSRLVLNVILEALIGLANGYAMPISVTTYYPSVASYDIGGSFHKPPTVG